jgi:outer membrane protein OmpA-like peptidoglycan-associated protein
MKHIIRTTTGALLAGMIAAGCSSTPPAADVAAANTAIDNAGQTIDRAANDPHVAKYASSELQRANDTLGKAKAAWNDKHDLHATTHLAYLAQQRAATAEQLANERASEDAVAVAAVNRDHAVAALNMRPRAVASTNTGQTQQPLAGFAFGKAKLPASARPAINDLANNLKNNPGTSVVIEGHTDNVGSPDYNHGLAMKRAEAVRAALVRDGVESSRITIQSQGEQNPVASNDTPVGRRENRRAEVIMSGGGETAVGSSQGTTATTSSSGQNPGQGQRGQ